MSISFVQRQAFAYENAQRRLLPWFAFAVDSYENAQRRLLPWFAFAVDTVKLFQDINYPIQVQESVSPYLMAADVSRDIAAGVPLRVWQGGQFSLDHPMNQVDPTSGHKIYVLARAVHDHLVHHEGDYTFEPIGELRGALASRNHYSELALPALWTDDVAMGCHYAHFGEWPKIQRPVICTPDWEGLEEYLKGAK